VKRRVFLRRVTFQVQDDFMERNEPPARGPLTYLDLEEGQKNEANLEVAKARSWELWKRAALEKMTAR